MSIFIKGRSTIVKTLKIDELEKDLDDVREVINVIGDRKCLCHISEPLDTTLFNYGITTVVVGDTLNMFDGSYEIEMKNRYNTLIELEQYLNAELLSRV